VASFTIAVPATLSNLGPGYDVLGMALELRNRFIFTVTEKENVFEVSGRAINAKYHLTFRTFANAIEVFGGTYSGGLSLHQEESIPRSRGLGSSATARAAGLLAYLKLTGREISIERQLAFLAKAEGHPDNVTPALRGGLTLCGHDDGELCHLVLPVPDLRVALCIPHKTISTKEARKILPQDYPQDQLVFSTSRIAFLVAGLLQNQHEVLDFAMKDVIHQPYRKTLIGPVDRAFEKATQAGALSAFISGSGSTLAAFVPKQADANAVAQAMASAFKDVACETLVVDPTPAGASIED
jgi:homoserine kinase